MLSLRGVVEFGLNAAKNQLSKSKCKSMIKQGNDPNGI